MESINIRLPNRLLAELRMLAHRESLARGATVRWTDLARAALAAFLRDEASGERPGSGQ